MKVLIAHPGMQHAYQLAWALEETGQLAGFWSGIPVVDARVPACGLWGRFQNRLRAVPIPARKRRHDVIFPLLQRLSSTLLSTKTANAWNHRIDHAYDVWVSLFVRMLKPDMVVCYENSALRTFRAARKVGAVCVLDAASIHYQAGQLFGGNFWGGNGGAMGINPVWINAQKQQEIECADAILTCSEFAAETYRAAGVPAEKLFPTPLGTEFPDISPRTRPVGGPCRFVFVGSLLRRKGAGMLLDVFEELEREEVQATLTLIGGLAEVDLAERAHSLGNVTVHPFIPQPRLFQVVAEHDCLLLPSLFDSFGMVVPEAMAVGLPAVVSERVGAKCVIEAHPGAGWIVPCEKEAFKAQVKHLAEQPALLVKASAAARAAALDYSWESYRRRVVQTLQQIHMRQGALVRK